MSPAPMISMNAQSALLAAAYAHVPRLGFTSAALRAGALDAGYGGVAAALFPRGAYELVLYHLTEQRSRLSRESAELLRPHVSTRESESSHLLGTPASTSMRVRTLALARLRANAPLIHKYADALALMSTHSSTSLAELWRLADDMCFLAGDTAVDASWYSKRAALAAVFASSEIFMTQDTSPDFLETERFLDRRLEEATNLNYAAQSTKEWLAFTGTSAVNVLRSYGAPL